MLGAMLGYPDATAAKRNGTSRLRANAVASQRSTGDLMLYISYGVDDPAKAYVRAATKEAHFAYLEQHKEKLVLGGALLADDSATPGRIGSVLIINVPSKAAADAFFNNEPFFKNGLFSSRSVTRMRRGQWNPAAAPKTAEGN
jgi:uncharacterized protein